MAANLREKKNIKNFEVVIIGAGFSGVYQLFRLRDEGFNVHLVEAGAGLGGIWHWNCYPGARVDTHCQIYQFSRKDLWEGWNWSERFPGWSEMRDYFDYVDEKLELSKDVSLNTRVEAARFDEAQGCWILETDSDTDFEATYIIVCAGFASKPYIPDLPGLEKFSGPAHHTALWPQDGIDFTGKKIGVIGTGASGIQVAQEASKVASELVVFQRTPNMFLPMGQERYSEEDNVKMKSELPAHFEARKESFGGFDFTFDPKSALEVSEAEREETYERLWEAGGFKFWLGVYGDIYTDETANRTAYEFWKKKTRERIDNPKLAEILAPSDPPHPYGVKRPSLEQWFFEIFNQDNVELVNLREERIDSVLPHGIKTIKREFNLDIIALATGFDAVTGGLTSINLIGTDGVALKDKWSKGVRTHLGLATANFPNMLMSYGPQAPTGFCNGPSSAEYQGECIVDMLKHLRSSGFSKFDVLPEYEEKWRNHIIDIASKTLFPKANSWYMGANIPGKTREILMYPAGLPSYLEEVKEAASKNYEGFQFS